MFSIASPWVPTMPNPDGGFASAADRQHIAFMYRGIAADEPVDYLNVAASSRLTYLVTGSARQTYIVTGTIRGAT